MQGSDDGFRWLGRLTGFDRDKAKGPSNQGSLVLGGRPIGFAVARGRASDRVQLGIGAIPYRSATRVKPKFLPNKLYKAARAPSKQFIKVAFEMDPCREAATRAIQRLKILSPSGPSGHEMRADHGATEHLHETYASTRLRQRLEKGLEDAAVA